MLNNSLARIAERVLAEEDITVSEADKLISAPIFDLLYCANKIRYKSFGNKVKSCSIINIKSGVCAEDCKFCAQSSQYSADIERFPLIESDKIDKAETDSLHNRAYSLGLVTSGKTPTSEELEKICTYIRNMNHLEPHASLGILTEEKAAALREAGLKMYNHNLETSRSFYPNICTTHSYDDRIKTVRIAKRYFSVCCGGLFGMGEDWSDRIELAFTLKELDVDCVPLNFLNPIPGTPLGHLSLLRPMDVLRIIAIYRFILPKNTIEIAGGREKNLRDLQSWIYYAGANASLIGNYLTTVGKTPEEDIAMIEDLELCIT